MEEEQDARRLAALGAHERPADLSKTFGYKRAEAIGALLNGIFLLAMAGVVFYVGYTCDYRCQWTCRLCPCFWRPLEGLPQSLLR